MVPRTYKAYTTYRSYKPNYEKNEKKHMRFFSFENC